MKESCQHGDWHYSYAREHQADDHPPIPQIA